MLYNIYTSSGTSSLDSTRVMLAIDEPLLKKIVEGYLRGAFEIKHDGRTYEFYSFSFQIYQIDLNTKASVETLRDTYYLVKEERFNDRWNEEIFKGTGSNVTFDFLKGRNWGDLKQDLYNIYINDGKNKPVILVLSKIEVDNFLQEWALGSSPIWATNRRIDLDDPKSIKIFDIAFEWLSDGRGNIRYNIKKYVKLGHDGSYNIEALEHFGKEVSDEFEIKPYGRSKPKTINFNWDLIHPEVARVAKGRFISPHYADAVEAAFKEINDLIKKEYQKKGNEELDGVKLMRTVFSPANPKIKLTQNITESDKNIQEGYMNIFSGVMTGIRNPKTHANIVIDEKDAWEKIVLASHLMKIWDNRIIENEKPTQTP